MASNNRVNSKIFLAFWTYQNDISFPAGTVRTIRSIARRGTMLLLVDMNTKLHVVHENGTYSHYFSLGFGPPWSIAVAGSSIFVSTSSYNPPTQKIFRVELTEDNHKISHKKILPKPQLNYATNPLYLSANGNDIAISYVISVSQPKTGLVNYNICSRKVTKVISLEGRTLLPQGVVMDSQVYIYCKPTLC